MLLAITLWPLQGFAEKNQDAPSEDQEQWLTRLTYHYMATHHAVQRYSHAQKRLNLLKKQLNTLFKNAPYDLMFTPKLRMAQQTLYRGDLEGTKHLLKVLQEELTQTYGDKHPLYLPLYRLQAALLQLRGNPSEAFAILEKSLALEEQLLHPKHPALYGSLLGLGDLLSQLSRGDEAKAHYQRALTIVMKASGPYQQARITLHNRLGQNELAARRPRQAARLLGAALSMEEARLGQGHPALIKPLERLAAALTQGGRWKESEKQIRRALAISREQFGSGSRQATRQTELLGDLAREGQDLAKAAQYYQEAIRLHEAAERVEIRNYAELKLKRARVHQVMGEWWQAEQTQRTGLVGLQPHPLQPGDGVNRNREVTAYRHIVKVLNQLTWNQLDPISNLDGAIITLQQRLKRLGFHPGEIDGHPGPNTLFALTGWRNTMGMASPPMRWRLSDLQRALQEVPPAPRPTQEDIAKTIRQAFQTMESDGERRALELAEEEAIAQAKAKEEAKRKAAAEAKAKAEEEAKRKAAAEAKAKAEEEAKRKAAAEAKAKAEEEAQRKAAAEAKAKAEEEAKRKAAAEAKAKAEEEAQRKAAAEAKAKEVQAVEQPKPEAQKLPGPSDKSALPSAPAPQTQDKAHPHLLR
ncbi:cell envelope integrity protein TolA [Magnetococcus sp. PR-3]|uniref:cell envelope integrity protein TolA n=1 Tax=Magnetococcus sp. PR-3 TaxID=3120355 RepID=UPI002FCE3822